MSAAELAVTVEPVQAGASTVHVRVAAVGSWFPAASVARTRNVCEPGVRPARSRGEAHAT